MVGIILLCKAYEKRFINKCEIELILVEQVEIMNSYTCVLLDMTFQSLYMFGLKFGIDIACLRLLLLEGTKAPYNVFDILFLTKPEWFKAPVQRTVPLLSFVSQSNFILIALDSQKGLHRDFLVSTERSRIP